MRLKKNISGRVSRCSGCCYNKGKLNSTANDKAKEEVIMHNRDKPIM